MRTSLRLGWKSCGDASVSRIVSCTTLVRAEENTRFPSSTRRAQPPCRCQTHFPVQHVDRGRRIPKIAQQPRHHIHISLTCSKFADFDSRLPRFRTTRRPNLACFQRSERYRTMPPRTRNQSRALARATRHASGLDNGETAHPTAVESRVSLPADVLYLIVAQCRRG